MKIYDFPLSPNCRKVRAIVYELGLSPEFVPVHLFKGEQRESAIDSVLPQGPRVAGACARPGEHEASPRRSPGGDAARSR